MTPIDKVGGRGDDVSAPLAHPTDGQLGRPTADM